jgi:hypothetical protein
MKSTTSWMFTAIRLQVEGKKFPIQEAKYAGLITLVSNYSCGEEMCSDPDSGTISIDWTPTFEPKSNFTKAATNPRSIVEKLMEVYSMSDEFKSSLIEKSRKWVHENYSTENVMKKILSEFDKMPLIKKRITTKDREKQNSSAFVPDVEDNQKWLMSLYENILGQIVSPNDDGMLHWMTKINQGTARSEIEKFFRQTASKGTEKENVSKEDYIKSFFKDSDSKRLLFVVSEGLENALALTSVLENCSKKYEGYDIYIGCPKEYFKVFSGNQYVSRLIPYINEMKNNVWLEGYLTEDRLFDISFQIDEGLAEKTYLHNDKDS